MKKIIFILITGLAYNYVCAQNNCAQILQEKFASLVGNGTYLTDSIIEWNPTVNNGDSIRELTYILSKKYKYRFAFANSEKLPEPTTLEIYDKNKLVAKTMSCCNSFTLKSSQSGEFKVVLINNNKKKSCTQLVLSIAEKIKANQKKEQSIKSKCDPELMEKVGSLIGNTTFLKDFFIELNAPCDFKMYTLALSKNTKYRWTIVNSEKYEGKNRLKIFDNYDELELIPISKDSFYFNCYETGTYHVRIEKEDCEKSCTLLILSYVEIIKEEQNHDENSNLLDYKK